LSEVGATISAGEPHGRDLGFLAAYISMVARPLSSARELTSLRLDT